MKKHKCKYCKKLGRYYPVIGKVLCEEHSNIHNNIRNLWEAVSHIQLEMPRNC